MSEGEGKPDLVSLIADIAREECRKLYEKRLDLPLLPIFQNRENSSTVVVHEGPVTNVLARGVGRERLSR